MRRSTKRANLNHAQIMQSQGLAVKVNLQPNGESSENQKSVFFDSGVIW